MTECPISSEGRRRPVRAAVALCIVMIAVLLAAGSLSQDSNNYTTTSGVQNSTGIPDVTIPASGPSIHGQGYCPVNERRVYSVVQGEPFTYRGTAPDSDIHKVSVTYYSDQDWFVFRRIPDPIPVDSGKTFSFTLSGNITKQLWDEYISGLDSPSYFVKSSPYQHVCLNYSRSKECFDLLIVQDAKNPTSLKHNVWIQIDPIPDQYVPSSERSQYFGVFFINGTTNLPPGEEIGLTIYSTCMLPCQKTASEDIGCCGIGGYSHVVKVSEGICGINTWSVLVNTTPKRIIIATVNDKAEDTNSFFTFVTWSNRLSNDNAWDLTHFVVRLKDEAPPPQPTALLYSMSVNYGLSGYTRPCYQLSGKTDIPDGSNISYSFSKSALQDQFFGGKVIAGKFTVTMNTTGLSGCTPITITIRYPGSGASDLLQSMSTTGILCPSSQAPNVSTTCPPLLPLPKPTPSPVPVTTIFGALLIISALAMLIRRKDDPRRFR